MRTKLFTLAISGLFLIASCKQQEKNKPSESIVENTTDNVAKVPDSWITKRVNATKTKLNNSRAGKIVWNAMEAHGGLKNWYNNGPISFVLITNLWTAVLQGIRTKLSILGGARPDIIM
jgi:hypothetical protein